MCVANNCAGAIPDLNLCTQPSSQQEWQAILSVIITEYTLVAQFDYAIRALFPANAVAFLANKTLQAASPGEVLGLPVIMAAPGNITSCVNWAALAGTGVQSQVSIGRSWQYITCQYFVGSESAVSPSNSLFPPQMVDQPAVCPVPEWESPDFNDTNEQWRAKFNFTDDALDHVTRLLITHGGSDRTTAIGSPRLTLSSDRNHSRVIVALGLGHGEQSFSETLISRGLKPQLDLVCNFVSTQLPVAGHPRLKNFMSCADQANLEFQLRDTQLAYIQEWLEAGTPSGGGHRHSPVPSSIVTSKFRNHGSLLK